jgi:hypothetical protein
MTPAARTAAEPRISAHGGSVRHLGAWTTSRRFHVRASRSSVVLDLLLPRIEPGEITLDLDLDHSMLKLLVPDGAAIDAGELRWSGKGRLKDWTGTSAPGGRTIKLVGEIRDGEVRVHRGGVAILTLILSRRHRREVREAHRDGRL